jgi:hypothetical protein
MIAPPSRRCWGSNLHYSRAHGPDVSAIVNHATAAGLEKLRQQIEAGSLAGATSCMSLHFEFAARYVGILLREDQEAIVEGPTVLACLHPIFKAQANIVAISGREFLLLTISIARRWRWLSSCAGATRSSARSTVSGSNSAPGRPSKIILKGTEILAPSLHAMLAPILVEWLQHKVWMLRI